jgi:hypothetical protein
MPPASSRREGQEQQWRTAVAMPDLPRPKEPWRLYKGEAMKIEEVVTFIKATREEAITLAYELGGAEVHALHIQRGFAKPAEKPVGYLVLPFKNKNT